MINLPFTLPLNVELMLIEGSKCESCLKVGV